MKEDANCSREHGLARPIARPRRSLALQQAGGAKILHHQEMEGLAVRRAQQPSRGDDMKKGQMGMTLDISNYEIAMEGEDMRAVVLTLDRGQNVPWHYHSTITDSFVCLKGPMVVETRAPRNTYVLNA